MPSAHPLLTSPVPHRRCVDGEAWEWDGVRFEILHPREADYASVRKSNALSCVLKVSAPAGALLLTGDIEAKDEAALLARHGDRLATDVMLPPHHGSRSSSSAEFLAGVSPSWLYFGRLSQPLRPSGTRRGRAPASVRRGDTPRMPRAH
ncbi:MAG: hypothetical protein IPP18_01225 [Rhodocyclaceae bacterium]|nr:hypothetical protein [Rhodocyclaceae bacterium]